MKFNNIINNILGALITTMLIGFVIWFGIATKTYMMLIGFLVIVCGSVYLCYSTNKCETEYYEAQENGLV